MTGTVKNKIIPACAFAVALMMAVGCSDNPPSTIKKEDAKTDSVKVVLLKADTAQKNLVLPGELMPYERAQLRAKLQGYIKKLNVDIGSVVRKGQVLALIDAPEIGIKLEESQQKVNAARSRYEASKDYFNRIDAASKTDGVVAVSELQRTKNQMLADSADFKAALFSASSNRQIGNYLAIVAPYNGIITERNIDVGSFVGTASEKPLFILENSRTLRLRVPIPEIYTSAVLIHNEADLTTRSFPDKKFKAKLVRKSGSISNDSRSEVWEFEVPNENGELKSGSYTDVTLHFIRSKPSLLAPASAVVTTLEKRFVIKVSGQKVQWIDVRTGFNMGEKQEIFGDVKAGDTLVLKANEEIKPGTNLIPKL